MNNINLIGRLTADPELKKTSNDISVCAFTVAVARPHVKDTTDFIRCVAWRTSAEFLCKYFCKGKMIALSGVLTVRNWKDEAEKLHSISEVVVESIEFCGDKKPAADASEPESDIPEGFSKLEEDIPF